MSQSSKSPSSVMQFAASLMPAWNFPAAWFDWPPDVFAFTSAVFERTGCYREVLAPDFRRGAEWQVEAEAAGAEWANWVSTLLAGADPRSSTRDRTSKPRRYPDGLEGRVRKLSQLAKRVSMEQLRVLSTEDSRELSRILIEIHAIADQACAGFGLPVYAGENAALTHCIGNLLLNSTGSLSVLPKHCGIVLPKMRTPQKGLTVRSLALHLTYHSTEVEVMWRAIPWPNVDENTLNVLVIPWPPGVASTLFEQQRDTLQSVRYFRLGRNGKEAEFPADWVLELIRQEELKHGCRVHVLVMPECSLSEREYRRLLSILSNARLDNNGIRWVPLVICGVRDTLKAEAAAVHRASPATDENLNEVRLAAYFAGRWYSLSQRKHHRWKLDRSQVRQYQLDGHLSTTRDWYEEISIGQRRLTFLAPTGWLTLCPLICEDLAQLEPVSELIRGVGPTLLVALLADGPQLETRWSARYASVFADDPGTAVLTLTSLGMARRSKRLEEPPRDEAEARRLISVGLWKDFVRGWRKVEIDGPHQNGGSLRAALLTISADWLTEYTADGRNDGGFAPTFKLDGLRILESAYEPKKQSRVRKERSAGDGQIWGHWNDIRELSAATFAFSTAVHLFENHKKNAWIVVDWLLGKRDRAHHVRRKNAPRLAALVETVRQAQHDPDRFGIAWRHEREENYQWSKDLSSAVQMFRRMLSRHQRRKGSYLAAFCDVAIADLASQREQWSLKQRWNQQHRIRLAVSLAVLSTIYNRLERWKQPPSLSRGGKLPLGTEEASLLLSRVEAALQKYS